MDDDFTTRNPSAPLSKKGQMDRVAEEQNVGGHFEGESERERNVGHDELVVVDIFKRNIGPDAGTYFLRVSLRNPIKLNLIGRFEADMDRYSNEADFLKVVEAGAGALAEDQCERWGAKWDCEYVARQAKEAAVELMREINDQ